MLARRQYQCPYSFQNIAGAQVAGCQQGLCDGIQQGISGHFEDHVDPSPCMHDRLDPFGRVPLDGTRSKVADRRHQ